MKRIIIIAKTELALMFYSPVAWLVLVIFSFQCALSFIGQTHIIIQALKMNSPVSAITSRMYGNFGFFDDVRQNLFLYIPLLTMGLMSREISSGSIKLLQSSPLNSLNIILGKYLGIIVFGFALVIILLLFVAAGNSIIVHADLKLMLSGVLGIYLMICTYCAIGLLMSCFTSYQLVAAITTFAVLAAFGYMGSLWQDIPSIRDISYMLSMSGRSIDFIQGLISSKNVIYYLIIITLALGFAIAYFHFRQHRTPLWKRLIFFILFTSIMILTGYITSRPFMAIYYDMTQNKARTVSKATRETLSKIKDPLKITSYVNLMNNTNSIGEPSRYNINYKFFEPYQRFLGNNIEMQYVYYYTYFFDPNSLEDLREANKGLDDKTIAKNVADAKGVDFKKVLAPSQIQNIIDLKNEKYRFIQVLQTGNKSSFLRVFDDPIRLPLEDEIAASLKELTSGPAIVGLAVNNQQRSIKNASKFDYQASTTEVTNRIALINQGFEFKEFNLDSTTIPGDISILVVADPKSELSEVATEKIYNYLKDGGNMLIAGEPGRQDNLNPVMKKLGLRFSKGKILQGSSKYDPDFISSHMASGAGEISQRMKILLEEKKPIYTPTVMAIEKTDSATGFNIKEIMITDTDTWNRNGTINMDSGHVSYNPYLGDVKQSLPVAVALTRSIAGKHQRVIVLGDADCISSNETERQGADNLNWLLPMAIYGWLSNDEFPVNTEIVVSKDNHLYIFRKDLPLLKGVFQAGIPLLLLFSGAILLFVRRRR